MNNKNDRGRCVLYKERTFIVEFHHISTDVRRRVELRRGSSDFWTKVKTDTLMHVTRARAQLRRHVHAPALTRARARFLTHTHTLTHTLINTRSQSGYKN
ncbi:hypothetical protein NL108_015865 [Boleophthalmus pectinirostris]|nr:hypothetical protein NL108_015865 [Boleophthalmus pectinirostris]